MDVGRYREALVPIGGLLESELADYNALCQKAVCHYELKEFQTGYDTTKAAISASPESEWAYRVQSLIFTKNGEHKRALQAAEIAIKKAPYLYETNQTLFYAQVNFGQLAEAKKTLATVLELSPDGANTQLSAGLLALAENDLENAESFFLEAVKKNPESVEALNNLGVVYIKMANSGGGEKYRKLSFEMFERSVRAEPQFKLGQTNMKAASEPRVKLRRSAGIFAIIFFLASSPLQTMLYLGFSNRLNAFSSYASLFSPLVGGAAIIALNLISIVVVCTYVGFGIWYYLINDTSRLPELITKVGFWVAVLAASLGAMALYLFLMFRENTDINSFPGMAFRSWLMLAMIAGISIFKLRNSGEPG